MNETQKKRKDFLVRKVYGKKYLDTYMSELKKLTRIEVSLENLLSLEETDVFKELNPIYEEYQNRIVKNFYFSEKLALREYFSKLISRYDGEVIILTDYSQYCGGCLLESLSFFNTDFNFEDEHAGIFFIYSRDKENILLIDFYEEDGDVFIEVEGEGKFWGGIDQ
jgi:hypothetical protein